MATQLCRSKPTRAPHDGRHLVSVPLLLRRNKGSTPSVLHRIVGLGENGRVAHPWLAMLLFLDHKSNDQRVRTCQPRRTVGRRHWLVRTSVHCKCIGLLADLPVEHSALNTGLVEPLAVLCTGIPLFHRAIRRNHAFEAGARTCSGRPVGQKRQYPSRQAGQQSLPVHAWLALARLADTTKNGGCRFCIVEHSMEGRSRTKFIPVFLFYASAACKLNVGGPTHRCASLESCRALALGQLEFTGCQARSGWRRAKFQLRLYSNTMPAKLDSAANNGLLLLLVSIRALRVLLKWRVSLVRHAQLQRAKARVPRRRSAPWRPMHRLEFAHEASDCQETAHVRLPRVRGRGRRRGEQERGGSVWYEACNLKCR